jgi:hypothetical protein
MLPLFQVCLERVVSKLLVVSPNGVTANLSLEVFVERNVFGIERFLTLALNVSTGVTVGLVETQVRFRDCLPEFLKSQINVTAQIPQVKLDLNVIVRVWCGFD